MKLSSPREAANRPSGGPRRWVLWYTLGALAVYAFWLVCMAVSGRTLLFHSDSFYQQYTTLRYTGEAVRRLLGGQGVRMVDFTLGQGLDALAALGFYGLTNPLYWVAGCIAGRGVEIYYHFLVFLYSWLAGLTFGAYLGQARLLRDEDRWAVPAGALMFAFCGYNTAGLLKCPYFVAGAICLCLTLTAVERFLNGGAWLPLCLATFLTLIVNFYLGYQTLLMAAAYILLRLASRLPERGVGRTVRDGLAIAGACACGVLLSGFMLLPTLAAFLSSGRTGAPAGYTASLLAYPADYYRRMAAAFAAPYAQAGYWTQLNFLPWTLAGVAALFLQKGDRRARWLRAGFLLALAGICVPLAGKVFNGFSYVANRWSYGFAFVCCACGAAGLPSLAREDFGHRRAAAAALAAWAILACALGAGTQESELIAGKLAGLPAGTVLSCVGGALLLCAAAALLYYDRHSARIGRRRAARFVCVTLALCALVYTGGYGVVMLSGDTFYPMGLDARIEGEDAALAAGIDDDGTFRRVDTGFGADFHASLLGYPGTGYYWSIVPGCMADYYRALEVPTLRWTFHLSGLGGDPYLCAAAAVGHAVRPASGGAVLPWGFEDAGGGIYRNRLALPLGVFFTDTLSEAAYDALPPVEKREALLSAAVLEGGGTALPALDGGTVLPVTVKASRGMAVGPEGMAGRAGDAVRLEYDAPVGSLAWLWIRDIRLTEGGNQTFLRVDGRGAGGAASAFYVSNPDGNYFYGQTGVFLYLGEAGEGPERLALRMAEDGAFSASDIGVVALPASDYAGRVEALLARGTWSPEVSDNAARGQFTAGEAGVLQVSIPYSKGWRATVDGIPTPLVRCGGMYLGVALEPGTHDIELRYETPWLRQGCAASVAGALLLAAALAAGRRGRRTAC